MAKQTPTHDQKFLSYLFFFLGNVSLTVATSACVSLYFRAKKKPFWFHVSWAWYAVLLVAVQVCLRSVFIMSERTLPVLRISNLGQCIYGWPRCILQDVKFYLAFRATVSADWECVRTKWIDNTTIINRYLACRWIQLNFAKLQILNKSL